MIPVSRREVRIVTMVDDHSPTVKVRPSQKCFSVRSCSAPDPDQRRRRTKLAGAGPSTRPMKVAKPGPKRPS